MNASDVERLVSAEVDGFVYEPPMPGYEPPMPGATVGGPWSEEKVRSYLSKLRVALVKSYQRRFVLRDTWEQLRAVSPVFAEYWVVAETAAYIEFFDPVTREFGLANREAGGEIPATIGVRGDLVGVFCAM